LSLKPRLKAAGASDRQYWQRGNEVLLRSAKITVFDMLGEAYTEYEVLSGSFVVLGRGASFESFRAKTVSDAIWSWGEKH
jgi:hypothetical protein